MAAFRKELAAAVIRNRWRGEAYGLSAGNRTDSRALPGVARAASASRALVNPRTGCHVAPPERPANFSKRTVSCGPMDSGVDRDDPVVT
jgi:hypothetical protein